MSEPGAPSEEPETDREDPTRRLQGFLWELAEEVIQAPTRKDIDQRVCDGLHSREGFDCVWICSTPPDGTPRTVVGRDFNEIDRLHAIFNDKDNVEPWVQAADDNRTVTTPISTNIWDEEYVLGCVPLEHRRINYGVLVVACRSRSKSEINQDLEALFNFGHIVGHALATGEMQTHGEIFRQAMEQAEPAFGILGEDGAVEYANAGFESTFGYPKSAVIDSTLQEVVDGIPSGILSTVETDSPWRDEVLCFRRNGREIHVDLSVAAVPIEGGTRLKYVATGTDITPIRESQQRLQVLNRVLRHNLRNDLDAIRGHIELAMDLAGPSIERHLETALDTTRDLLATAETSRNIQTGLSKTEIRDQDVVVLLKRLITRVEREYPSTELQISMPEALSISAADGLEDALWELLENACIHGTGTIEVSVERSGGRALIEVTDEGPGIPDHELRVIESREETPLEHGSGLGLWFAHWVINTSRGQLEFEVDGGTVVRVSIPVGEE